MKNNNYVVCLKHGDKYGPEYVNRLYNMVNRNITTDYEFVCFTENDSGVNKNIRIEPLPRLPNVKGWWYKPMFFNPGIGLDGNILFMDLDVIVFNNIDDLFLHKPEKFCIIRDFNRYVIKNYKKFNSSVFRLTVGDQSHVYEKFIKNPDAIMKKFRGDQDYFYSEITNFEYWDDEWIRSYKWEMRGNPTMITDKYGNKNFKNIANPVITPGNKIAVFHGHPNPGDCADPWVKEHWV
jgi:hypothetical protein